MSSRLRGVRDALRRERQMEGIAKAKERGVYAGKGRPPKIDRNEIVRLKGEGSARQRSPGSSASIA